MDEKAPQYNGGVPKKREYVDEYTKLFKAIYRQQYKDQANLPGGFSEQDFLNTLVIEESVHKKQVGFFKDLLEKVSQITIVVPVIEGILERELGTGDRLTSGEAKGKLIDGGIQAVTLGYGVLTSAGKEVLLDIARSAGSDIAETTVATTLKHAGVNEDISEGIGILTRMKVDKLLTGQSGIRNVEEAFDHVHIKGNMPIDIPELEESTLHRLEKHGLTMDEGLDKIGTGRLANPKGPVGTLQESISKNGINLSDEMVRYDDYWKKVKTGETGHPGMSHEEYAKWKYGDGKVLDHTFVNRVDSDEYLKFKGSEAGKQKSFIEGVGNPEFTSLRDLMSPEEVAKYDKHWAEVAERISNEALDNQRNFIKNGGITKPGGGAYKPAKISAAVDMNTGDISFGYNGANKFNPSRNTLKPELQTLIDNTKSLAANDLTNPYAARNSYELWSVDNCAEVYATNNALINGANIDNIFLNTQFFNNGAYAEPCANCKITFKNFGMPNK